MLWVGINSRTCFHQEIRKISTLFYWKTTTKNTLQQFSKQRDATLTFTTVWANSADEKLIIFFLILPENRL